MLPRPWGPLPTAIAEVLGTITAEDLFRAAYAGRPGPVLDLARPVRFVGIGEPRTDVLARLGESDDGGLLVVRDRRLAGVVGRADLTARSITKP